MRILLARLRLFQAQVQCDGAVRIYLDALDEVDRARRVMLAEQGNMAERQEAVTNALEARRRGEIRRAFGL